MNKDVIIRLATKEDKARLSDFFKHYNSDEIARNRIECYASHNATVVAQYGNKIIGILQWYIKEDPKAGVVEFEEINVMLEYQKQGIGSGLLDKAIELVRQSFEKLGLTPRRIYLFVSESNTIARRLYEKHGFTLEGNIRGLFTDGEAELFYMLRL